MNTLLNILFLSLSITLVICDTTEECMKKGNDALVGKSDDQLLALTQDNLKTATVMVQKRALTAEAQGLPCYKQFYDTYVKGLQGILLNTSETDRLAKAKTPAEKSGAIKDLAGLTQGIICDENWRAIHFNETIASANCTLLEQNTFLALDVFNFRPKLLLLENGLLLGKFALRFNNNVMSGIIGEILSLYAQIYKQGETCAQSQSNAADKCRNLKMFVLELNRLFELFGLTLESKIES